MSQNDFNEFKDLGRQIKDSVMSVVNMQEFNDLKTTIKAATQDLSKDLKSAFKTGVPPTGPVPPSAGTPRRVVTEATRTPIPTRIPTHLRRRRRSSGRCRPRGPSPRSRPGPGRPRRPSHAGAAGY